MRGFVAACALTYVFSGTLDAQCGWILWQKSDTTMKDGKAMLSDPIQWTVHDGFADIEQCRDSGVASLKHLSAVYRDNLKFTVEMTSQARTASFVSKDMANIFIMEMRCFPSGFDPRR